ncbi:MAG: peptidylprolyl isomerase [Gemmatimonadota bacterium]
MTGFRGIALALVLPLAAGCGGSERASEEAPNTRAALPPDFDDMTPTVVLETSMGDIVMELDRGKAPLTVGSIVDNVDAGFYDGLTFHRIISGFMIQGGGYTPDMGERQSGGAELRNEAHNGLKNQRGSVAMARTSAPHSAKNQFFINLVNNSQLDHTSQTDQGWGYTVFGRVIEGMDVVDAIAAVETTTNDKPVEPVLIERAYFRE